MAPVLAHRTPGVTTSWGESLQHLSATSLQTGLGSKQYPVGAKHSVGVKGETEFRLTCSGCYLSCGKKDFGFTSVSVAPTIIVNSCDKKNKKITYQGISSCFRICLCLKQ